MNLVDDLERRAAEVGDRPGLYVEDGRSWTFAELDGAASAVADALHGLGVRRGSRVGVYLRNGPHLVTTIFGAWKLGAVPVTVSALYNATELAESIVKSSPVLLIADDHNPAALIGALETVDVTTRIIAGDVPGVEPLGQAASSRRRAVSVAADDEAGILFTGGTTGRPKAVIVSHGGVLDSLARLARVSKAGRPGPYPAAHEDVPPNLVALPLFHGGGQHTLLFAFHVGKAAVLWERFGIETLRTLLRRHRFDNLFLMPTMLYDIVHAAEPPDLSSVRSVLIAGQALSIHLRRQFEERFAIPIVMNYGSTETGHLAGWTAADMRAGLWKPGSAGRVYDDVELEIRDDEGHAVEQGMTGEIVVRSAMTRGYVDDPLATSELVQDGWVHSGDVGYLDPDGVLFLVGRKRDMIKCGGFQVWPDEVEEALRAHPLVLDVRVHGVPDDRLGEIPQAVVVRAPDAAVDDQALRGELILLARERLAHFKAPRKVVFIAELPRSEAGKVRRDVVTSSVGREEGS